MRTQKSLPLIPSSVISCLQDVITLFSCIFLRSNHLLLFIMVDISSDFQVQAWLQENYMASDITCLIKAFIKMVYTLLKFYIWF